MAAPPPNNTTTEADLGDDEHVNEGPPGLRQCVCCMSDVAPHESITRRACAHT